MININRIPEMIYYISHDIVAGWLGTHGEKFETYIIRRLTHRFGVDNDTVEVIKYVLDPEFKEGVLRAPGDVKMSVRVKYLLEAHFNG